jgi:hypothetical protein
MSAESSSSGDLNQCNDGDEIEETTVDLGSESELDSDGDPEAIVARDSDMDMDLLDSDSEDSGLQRVPS